MGTATVHIAAADLELSGSYEELGDVLYLSAPIDDKTAPAQETPGQARAQQQDGQHQPASEAEQGLHGELRQKRDLSRGPARGHPPEVRLPS